MCVGGQWVRQQPLVLSRHKSPGTYDLSLVLILISFGFEFGFSFFSASLVTLRNTSQFRLAPEQHLAQSTSGSYVLL